MVAFLSSILLMVVLLALAVPVGKKRPIGTPVSWGEAMLGATYAFFLMFWAYGVIPHLWLLWADSELKWRPDKYLHGPGAILKPQTAGGWNPITLNYQVLRDIIATLIYIVFLGLQMWVWVAWQKRGSKKPKTAVATSDFGRPLVKPVAKKA